MIKVTPQSCECNFHTSMNLPCRYIFAVRHSICMPLFDPELVNKRWTKNNYLNYLRNILNTNPSNIITETQDNIAISTISKSNKPKSVLEKRRLATMITNEIADAISLLNEIEFQQMINLLKEFKNNIINRNFCIPTLSGHSEDLDGVISQQSQDLDIVVPDISQNVDIAVSEPSQDLDIAVPDNSQNLNVTVPEQFQDLSQNHHMAVIPDHDYFILPAVDDTEMLHDVQTLTQVEQPMHITVSVSALQPSTSGLNDQIIKYIK